ncbi:Pam16-domain-containing protein [Blyttiomyces helicus]|uniref:Mitochondrial import inner membrane translocase subunit TIM16 n=1 Tax=Blyttiomyces helicus TaxID=388810 RepID=A0A4P9WG69_9FUNG|nr:Pam16-domain-containing protein [Blyttiomyces helicus]|eukprot:RKO90803.1 Pam16-domain-containing protein [Blyttiomyces helicus]
MAARIVTQIIIVGTQIFGRAFVEAYKTAAANAAKGGAAAGGKGAADAATRKTGMTIDEAAQILNVEKDAPMEEVMKRYEHLFKQNDPASGSSHYLQSKVFRARERLELESERKQPQDEASSN